jgi:maltose alpha-D-glucosyltransferase/alpha-amylase
LHEALLSDDVEAFTPEPFTTLWQRSLYQAFRAQVAPTLQLLRRSIDRLPEEARENAIVLLDAESEILAIFQRVRDHRIDAMRSRVHGDYHLGQVLHAGRDFVIIDFEGEPSRSPTQRRIKRSPLSDVAGMVRSFQYAARAGFNAYEERGLVTAETRDALHDRGDLWNAWVTLRFLTGYFEAIASTGLVPASAEDRSALLSAYVLDKALYEVRYELNNRPDWAPIPIEGVVQIIEAGRTRA